MCLCSRLRQCDARILSACTDSRPGPALHAGQIVFSPKDDSATGACPTYFGFVAHGSTPPPYGSGTIFIYDYDLVQHVATYSPTAFVVEAQNGCYYHFGAPQTNVPSADIHRLVLARPLEGPSCPAPQSSPCHQGYWAVTSAAGIFALLDSAAGGKCPAFVARAAEGSDHLHGSFGVGWIAAERAVVPAPPGWSGSYSTKSGVVTLDAPGCRGVYVVSVPEEWGGRRDGRGEREEGSGRGWRGRGREERKSAWIWYSAPADGLLPAPATLQLEQAHKILSV